MLGFAEANLSKNRMTKMTNQHLFRGGIAGLAAIALCAMSVTLASAQQAKRLRIIQTNSAGDNIHIIDPATNKVVGEIKGIEAPHGIAVSPDGSRIYVSEEADKTSARDRRQNACGDQAHSVERQSQPDRYYAGREDHLRGHRPDVGTICRLSRKSRLAPAAAST